MSNHKTTVSPIDSQYVLLLLVSFRLLNAVTLRTFFQPDEYYQALEPAWNFVPGHNGAWITWEWTQHLRSAIHPALFSSVYYIAGLISQLSTKPDVQQNILILAPKVAQSIIAALGDYCTWKLALNVYGSSNLASAALYLTILNPWQWFCSTRTFSNGLESTLTVAALCYWPFDWRFEDTATGQHNADTSKKPKASEADDAKKKTISLRKSLLLAATATMMRPTNIIIWITLASVALFDNQLHPETNSAKPSKDKQKKNDTFTSKLTLLAKEGTISGSTVLITSAIIDRAFYATWTFPALNFLYFNVVQSLAVFYGNNDWHYYLSQGYPLLLTTALPFALLGMYRILRSSSAFLTLPSSARKSLKQLVVICLTLPATLSVLSHKEVRFIYPILGPLHVIAAAPAFQFFEPLTQSNSTTANTDPRKKTTRYLALILILSLNLTIAGYTSLIHNSGLIALPDYLRDEFNTYYNPTVPTNSHKLTQPQNMTLAILMPCHSLPWRSHILNPPSTSHPGIQGWALTCEPPLHLTSPESKSTYLDEADVFYANPTLWLRKNMSRNPPTKDSARSPGIHVSNPQHRNKNLWTSASPSLEVGLDITDLLPYLRTAPGRAPSIESERVRRPWPDYLVFFAQLEPTMMRALRGSGYVQCWRVFNSHWHDDWRRTGDVVVWCLFPERAVGVDGGLVRGDRVGDGDGKGGEGEGVWEREGEERVVPDRPGSQRVIRNAV